MSLEQKHETLKSLLTHYAKQGKGHTRVPTSMAERDLLKLPGARKDGDVVSYPHQWRWGTEWITTRFELVPK